MADRLNYEKFVNDFLNEQHLETFCRRAHKCYSVLDYLYSCSYLFQLFSARGLLHAISTAAEIWIYSKEKKVYENQYHFFLWFVSITHILWHRQHSYLYTFECLVSRWYFNDVRCAKDFPHSKQSCDFLVRSFGFNFSCTRANRFSRPRKKIDLI